MTKTHLIDSTPSLVEVLDSLDNLPTSPPSLYIDLEGINLSREGSISILQLFNHPKEQVYLIDVHLLGETAFTTTGTNGTSLKSILECADTPKVFFDVRNDSNALFFHFGIRLRGVEDIQLMENATRPGLAGRKKFVSGLARCVEQDAPVSPAAKKSWKEKRDTGLRLSLPDRGGSVEVFNLRPMPRAIKEYCAQHLLFLPLLRSLYWLKLSPEWEGKVASATKERVRVSQTLTYQPNTRDKTLSPWQSLNSNNYYNNNNNSSSSSSSNYGRTGIPDGFLRRLDLFGGR
ncbi:hypothetical protein ACJ72_08292 [Emergomyces africanus]|uniref:3'-5' exonuclease domain-containing protein n=1 Tax=Emergomyces africanus TaxID=1955775 RepID=A0A1B7NLE9_9EURO|nr:hypothetical protein ACJ72_08292 [Emergomyces africanus]